MTPQELNRDIKRLVKKYHAIKGTEDYFARVKDTIEPEWIRIYRADREMTYMNKESIKAMLRMNLLFRFIPLHQFGLNIEL